MVSQQIILEHCIVTPEDAAVSVTSFGMSGYRQALGNDTPLHGTVSASVGGQRLVRIPAESTMVNHKGIIIAAPKRIHGVSALYQIS